MVVAVLGLGVLAVIGNTIRLEIQQRRPEIEVTKLVGGSNAFVRRPFLYTGIFYGLGGALLAALIVVRRPGLPRPGGGRAVGPVRQPLPPGGLGRRRDWGSSSGSAPASAGSGALISTGRHLRQIEPARLSAWLLEQ